MIYAERLSPFSPRDSTENICNQQPLKEGRHYHSIPRFRFGPPGVLALPPRAGGVERQL